MDGLGGNGKAAGKRPEKRPVRRKTGTAGKIPPSIVAARIAGAGPTSPLILLRRRPRHPAARCPPPQFMSSNLHPMLSVAIKAARAAGAIINRAALDVESVRISQKQINDFVTEV